MPTEEFKSLLDRAFAKASAAPITEIASPLLRELVNAALWAFRRCEMMAAENGRENEDIAALVLFRQIIEMADGVEVLTAEGCGTAAIPALRSQFEASLGLSFLLSDESKYIQRSLAWLVVHINSEIRERESLEPGTQKGADYAKLYEQEFGRPVSLEPNAPIAAEIKEMHDGLRNPQFGPVEAEYQRTKQTTRKRFPEWFSLFDGPNTRKALAEQTGNGALYTLIYGDWSALGHGNDLGRFLSMHNGRPAWHGVRQPNELQQIAQHSALLLLRAIREMITKFRGEDLAPWYQREVKPLLNRLGNMEIEFTSLAQE